MKSTQLDKWFRAKRFLVFLALRRGHPFGLSERLVYSALHSLRRFGKEVKGAERIARITGLAENTVREAAAQLAQFDLAAMGASGGIIHKDPLPVSLAWFCPAKGRGYLQGGRYFYPSESCPLSAHQMAVYSVLLGKADDSGVIETMTDSQLGAMATVDRQTIPNIVATLHDVGLVKWCREGRATAYYCPRPTAEQLEWWDGGEAEERLSPKLLAFVDQARTDAQERAATDDDQDDSGDYATTDTDDQDVDWREALRRANGVQRPRFDDYER